MLARKYRNLHIYGCWWFCNNPSIITEITTMRLEMIGIYIYIDEVCWCLCVYVRNAFDLNGLQ